MTARRALSSLARARLARRRDHAFECAAPPDCDIRLFLDFANTDTRETPDPYYGGDRGFERVLDLLEQGAEGLLDHLEDEDDA